MKKPILISGCLLGLACRYDGKSKPLPDAVLNSLHEHYSLIPVCPEQLGGLSTPRAAAEFDGKRFVTQEHTDVTDAYRKGAEEVLYLAKIFEVTTALLKEKSPACGYGKIYDGTFTHTLTDGNGAAAELLSAHGITVFGESQIQDLLP